MCPATPLSNTEVIFQTQNWAYSLIASPLGFLYNPFTRLRLEVDERREREWFLQAAAGVNSFTRCQSKSAASHHKLQRLLSDQSPGCYDSRYVMARNDTMAAAGLLVNADFARQVGSSDFYFLAHGGCLSCSLSSFKRNQLRFSGLSYHKCLNTSLSLFVVSFWQHFLHWK